MERIKLSTQKPIDPVLWKDRSEKERLFFDHLCKRYGTRIQNMGEGVFMKIPLEFASVAAFSISILEQVIDGLLLAFQERIEKIIERQHELQLEQLKDFIRNEFSE